MDYLIKKGALRQQKGNFGEDLIVTGKFSIGRRKQRFLTTPMYNYLLRLKEKDKQGLVLNLNLDKVKSNQRYLFSSGNLVRDSVSVS